MKYKPDKKYYPKKEDEQLVFDMFAMLMEMAWIEDFELFEPHVSLWHDKLGRSCWEATIASVCMNLNTKRSHKKNETYQGGLYAVINGVYQEYKRIMKHDKPLKEAKNVIRKIILKK